MNMSFNTSLHLLHAESEASLIRQSSVFDFTYHFMVSFIV
jgi:hypothetical protein